MGKKRKFVTFEIAEGAYPMSEPQAAQIDCRVEDCDFNEGRGVCGNTAPAITLNPANAEPQGSYVCWSQLAEEG